MNQVVKLLLGAILCHTSLAGAALPTSERISDEALLASVQLVREGRARGGVVVCDIKCARLHVLKVSNGLILSSAVMILAHDPVVDLSKRFLSSRLADAIRTHATRTSLRLFAATATTGFIGGTIVMAAEIADSLSPSELPSISISDSILKTPANLERFLDLDETSMFKIARNEPRLAAELSGIAAQLMETAAVH